MIPKLTTISFFVLIFLLIPQAISQEVSLEPSEMELTGQEEAKVELWVNNTDSQGGQINLTYNPACINITHFEIGDDFAISGHDSGQEGREFITFATLTLMEGQYLVGTLSLQCIQAECNSSLYFDNGSDLFDPFGQKMIVNWSNGEYKCLVYKEPTATPTPDSGEDEGTTENGGNDEEVVGMGGGGGGVIMPSPVPTASITPDSPDPETALKQIETPVTPSGSAPGSIETNSGIPTPTKSSEDSDSNASQVLHTTGSVAALAVVIGSIAGLLYLIVRT